MPAQSQVGPAPSVLALTGVVLGPTGAKGVAAEGREQGRAKKN